MRSAAGRAAAASKISSSVLMGLGGGWTSGQREANFLAELAGFPAVVAEDGAVEPGLRPAGDELRTVVDGRARFVLGEGERSVSESRGLSRVSPSAKPS